MNRRWRNMGGGPHSSIGEYQNRPYIEESPAMTDDETPFQQKIIDDNLKSKEDIPGPGQYYSYEKFSTLNLKLKQPRFQFFDSTEDRFKGSVFGHDEAQGPTPSKVGPGSYEPKSEFDQQRQHRNHQDIGKHQTEIKRVFDVSRDEISKPGPGAYKQNSVKTNHLLIINIGCIQQERLLERVYLSFQHFRCQDVFNFKLQPVTRTWCLLDA